MQEKIYPISIIKKYFPFEFPISGNQWEFYDLAGVSGIIPPKKEASDSPDPRLTRQIVKNIYAKKDFTAFGHQQLKAGDLNAIGLIIQVSRYLLHAYTLGKNPGAFEACAQHLKTVMSAAQTEQTVSQFAEMFPPEAVLLNGESFTGYIDKTTVNIPNRRLAAKEIMLLKIANKNPAFSPFLELFGDARLSRKSQYDAYFTTARDFFKTQPGFGPENKSIIELLLDPIRHSPYSLAGQLLYIQQHWSSFLPEEFLRQILVVIDIIKEEAKYGSLGRGPNLVLDFKGLAEYQDEYEYFTRDKDWMSRVVVIAKSTYVWLDQLSKKYQRDISKLDHIPDEELDLLARWGFSGLWLIGLWERSPASRTIKQICGNPEALSSAYSVYDYTISEDLGGVGALENLKHRALKRGIIIAADIVPNHTGIYSKWIIEHPDWFIQLDYPPFPGYSFTGPDLSHDPRVGIFIEDGYWTRRDAAVVFKRVDKWTGDTKYIYHGNDGTSMPWNDTAQLNFLNANLREAVIQSILRVVRQFPIIRLDAAMTLAKKHYQRLWFPQPGTGGGIPSRAEHGMDRGQFDLLMPKEFWREVVDRINNEAPDTLLIAEAFWLMEGYFVRTLGMHRVYNSAFMNMLKTEENSKYRSVIKNVLEFNPEILRRFANFMNNPDEETAVAQFGKGDKYFGICLMLVTLPGLPMFGHGQIEGCAEKYGMEYRRAYWDEHTDWDLVRRHEHEIFPLMRKRHLFSGVENFVFYDFFRPDGLVNEDVFAYSNRSGDEKALIIYNNRYDRAAGWVKSSCAFSAETGTLIQKTLGEALCLKNDTGYYYVLRDNKSGLEYIRPGQDLCQNGMYVELDGFGYHAFLGFREIKDSPAGAGHYGRLCAHLNGAGVPNIEETLQEIVFADIYRPLRTLINEQHINGILDGALLPDTENNINDFFSSVKSSLLCPLAYAKPAEVTLTLIKAVTVLKDIQPDTKSTDLVRASYLWALTSPLGKLREALEYERETDRIMDQAGLYERVINSVVDARLLRILILSPDWEKPASTFLKSIFNDHISREYLEVNQHDNIWWFSKERFETVIRGLYAVSCVKLLRKYSSKTVPPKGLQQLFDSANDLIDKARRTGYNVEKMYR